jgi:hypothetical protein
MWQHLQQPLAGQQQTLSTSDVFQQLASRSQLAQQQVTDNALTAQTK